MSDTVIIWDAPVITKPEFRLYYDEAGRVISYTCDKPDGNYIVIDASTFAQCRPDLRVIDGKISTVSTGAIVSKLIHDVRGISCAAEDISIVIDNEDSYTGNITKWKLITHEL
jgi:hypothetical protein